MALLAFRPNTSCGIYKALFDESRWDKLVQEFKKNNYELHSLTSQSPLDMTLQVGLSALKTPGCYQEENQNVQCPVCAKETLGKLAQGLPFAHHVNSCLVCRISGEIMNEHNPPLVLPNGYVYSRKALEEQAEKRQRNSLNSLETESSVICPRTGEVVTLSQCRKAFIL
jgi:macrophage erythroblast attacher